MKTLIFAGTSEGRRLAEWAAEQGFDVTVSVATDYGFELMKDVKNPGVHVLCGRLEENEIMELARGFDLIVDATHPYAVQVTMNLRQAAEETNKPYFRLLRQESGGGENVVIVPDPAAALQFLEKTQGAVLLTTGSQGIDVFTALTDYDKRLYVRILPSEAAIRKCRQSGIRPDHMIAMQGPFQEGLNRELMKQFDIKILVTKDSGPVGGTDSKIRAARSIGATVVLIRRPFDETGYSLEEIKQLMIRKKDGDKT